jgi:hypothetical protein
MCQVLALIAPNLSNAMHPTSGISAALLPALQTLQGNGSEAHTRHERKLRPLEAIFGQANELNRYDARIFFSFRLLWPALVVQKREETPNIPLSDSIPLSHDGTLAGVMRAGTSKLLLPPRMPAEKFVLLNRVGATF